MSKLDEHIQINEAAKYLNALCLGLLGPLKQAG